MKKSAYERIREAYPEHNVIGFTSSGPPTEAYTKHETRDGVTEWLGPYCRPIMEVDLGDEGGVVYFIGLMPG